MSRKTVRLLFPNLLFVNLQLRSGPSLKFHKTLLLLMVFLAKSIFVSTEFLKIKTNWGPTSRVLGDRGTHRIALRGSAAMPTDLFEKLPPKSLLKKEVPIFGQSQNVPVREPWEFV